ncbi:type 2 DNA topoisomerase 6 subunit B-like isoform X3 [Capsicum annuum]|nr:type 2 DNA topoisomerase 6 subunit B-like isoform X3 [Capsicum annuum]XP_016574904.1 type 2 DNA topoisomerase 6 subunit B-like isoform X3 [Capsicum annuum]XP_016574905.1 type 2 DNA topoisomerase 6 subunit B-like isoform X3 [Capsicum annuum]
MLYLATTSVSDSEIHNLNLNLKESNSVGTLTKLPSTAKNGAKFSGTEVSVSISKSLDDLLAEVTCFLQKVQFSCLSADSTNDFSNYKEISVNYSFPWHFMQMILLKVPKVVMELLVGGDDSLGSQIGSRILVIEGSSVYSPVESIKCLKLGLKDYVRKHQTRFSVGENLKVGTGVANSSGSSQGNSQVVEAVVIISEMSELVPSSCIREQDMKTEVLYFEDFVSCSIAQSSLDALTNINWKSYGLALRSIANHDGSVMLEWENLLPDFHIHIAIHCYHRQVKQWVAENSLPDRNLVRKAVKCALDDLKENNQGVLLSRRALKMCDYAPDLAKTLAQLILSSNDLNFQEECCSLLGVQSQEVNMDNVGNCIREKIISVIGLNDRNSQKNKEAPTFLFEDDCFQKEHFMEEEYHEGEEAYNFLDL